MKTADDLLRCGSAADHKLEAEVGVTNLGGLNVGNPFERANLRKTRRENKNQSKQRGNTPITAFSTPKRLQKERYGALTVFGTSKIAGIAV
ncbi:hypothetical protein C2I18_21000 [Paenibacillus sp. PK3_47]|nr:hypothetical protein C2I18_21000 [Paenibacillus sp. PK3_47]